MKISDLIRLAKEIQRQEGDIEIRYETGFMQIEPLLDVRKVSEKKVLVISGPRK